MVLVVALISGCSDQPDVHEVGASPEETWVCGLLGLFGVDCDGDTVAEVQDRVGGSSDTALGAILCALTGIGCDNTNVALDLDYRHEVPLSYSVRQAQLGFAGPLRDCITANTYYDPAGPPGPMVTTSWLPNDQLIGETANPSGANFAVRFDFTGFDPEESRWEYRQAQALNTITVDHPEATIDLDNRQGVGDETFERTATVTLHQSTTTETDVTIKVDLTTKAGVTIGGEASGGSIEGSIETTFGITEGKRDIESESRDRTVTETVKPTVPKGEELQVLFSSPRTTTSTPFSVVGAMESATIDVGLDAGLSYGTLSQLMHGPRYSGPGPQAQSGRHSIRFTGFDDLFDALSGTNVNFPALSGPLFPDCVDHLDSLRDISWHGTLKATADESVNVRYQRVG